MEIFLPEQQGAGGPSFFFPASAFAKIGPTRVFGQANINANLGRSQVREGLVRSVGQIMLPRDASRAANILGVRRCFWSSCATRTLRCP